MASAVETLSSLPLPSRPERATPAPLAYPACPEQIPAWHLRRPPYRVRFARSTGELHAIQRLRYRVFNLELGEGLAESRATGRDADGFDAASHHLLVFDERAGLVVGTYRLATLELASLGGDFYSAQEFDLSGLAPSVLAGAVELGRACVAASHRGRSVLWLLFQGIAAYAAHNRKRFLFGCASLPGALAPAAGGITRLLAERGAIDPALEVQPRAGFEPPADGGAPAPDADVLPPLVRRYLALGARLAARPAHDRTFGTLDYFTMIDLARAPALPAPR